MVYKWSFNTERPYYPSSRKFCPSLFLYAFYISYPYSGCIGKKLKSWHFQDPPDRIEKIRNSVIEQVQGNWNPFIDYPESVKSVKDF
ncbi:MAG: hypothetical protein HN474_09645 [Nitrospina sp.]|nr:hypothetical protein [Nitrospina sp.]